MATLRTRSGAKLTKKVIDALAEEAERGYDLTKAKRVRMGRTALGDGGSSPRVQLRVDPNLDKALRACARRSTARSARYVERSLTCNRSTGCSNTDFAFAASQAYAG